MVRYDNDMIYVCFMIKFFQKKIKLLSDPGSCHLRSTADLHRDATKIIYQPPKKNERLRKDTDMNEPEAHPELSDRELHLTCS